MLFKTSQKNKQKTPCHSPAVHALTPPFGGGLGFQLDLVETRLITLSSTPPLPPPPPSPSRPASTAAGPSLLDSSYSSSSNCTPGIACFSTCAWCHAAPTACLSSPVRMALLSPGFSPCSRPVSGGDESPDIFSRLRSTPGSRNGQVGFSGPWTVLDDRPNLGLYIHSNLAHA